MVTFGGDGHKRTHTLVAVDENGRQVGERTVAATPTGHMEAMGWARQWPERRWALENCRHLSRVLERDLLSAGESVVQVSPKLMGSARRFGREVGKSDPLELSLCHAQRHRPDSGLVWQSGTSPSQPRWQPSAERRPASNRDYSDSTRRCRLGLHCSSPDHGQHQN